MNLTKFDIIQEAAQRTGISQVECRETFDGFTSEIFENMLSSNSVELRDFGTFYTMKRKPRPARNPRTGKVCKVPARRVMLFRFSPEIKNNINQTKES